MYDTFHANIEEKSPQSALDTIKDYLIHIHILRRDFVLRGVRACASKTLRRDVLAFMKKRIA